ncbi:MAG TPA: hypothetical protein VNW51_00750 [Mucilaginibacter sp.]|nr:hypothetical protein [Mucilaginibacter sp.]
MSAHSPLRLCTFGLIQKYQKIKSAATLLCARSHCAAKQVKPGEGPVAAVYRTSPSLQATFRTPLQPRRPALFYLLSPEAARPTGQRSKSKDTGPAPNLTGE